MNAIEKRVSKLEGGLPNAERRLADFLASLSVKQLRAMAKHLKGQSDTESVSQMGPSGVDADAVLKALTDIFREVETES